jgi:O-antigen/teichoic acid export membrane protein
VHEEKDDTVAIASDASPVAPDFDARSAILLAIRNALTLGGALLLTQTVGLTIRVVLPRHLGPTLFGELNFADAFTATLFVALRLGMDTYMRKEVAVRPSSASEFYGGAFLVRVGMTLGLLAIIAVILRVSHRSADRAVVFLFAFYQFAVSANGTLGALLHAKGRVRGMSALSVATKVAWAAGVLSAITAHAGLWAYAASYLVPEAVEVVVLTALARQHIGLAFRVDVAATKRLLRNCLPFYIGDVAVAAYGTLGVTLLEFTAGNTEVGLYGAAWALASVTLLITPIIGWVLSPMLARAAARSRAELYEHVGSSMVLGLTLAVPASMLMNLGADLWMSILGAHYAPAVPALRVLSMVFVLTYMAMIFGATLVMMERAWMVTWIAVTGLVLNGVLNLVLVHYSIRLLGPGGGGTGCAAAMLGTEVFVIACMAWTIGRGAFDRRTIGTVVRILLVYVVVVVVHRLLWPLAHARLAIDVVLYFVLAIALGAFRPRDMLTTVRQALRKETPGPGPAVAR